MEFLMNALLTAVIFDIFRHKKSGKVLSLPLTPILSYPLNSTALAKRYPTPQTFLMYSASDTVNFFRSDLI